MHIDDKMLEIILTHLRASAFALETVAHLRGLERELLPHAENGRALAALLSVNKTIEDMQVCE